MNSLVEIYRKHYPEDLRGDDEITVELSKRYPDVFAGYPDAQADLSRINQEVADALKPSTIDYIKQGLGSTERAIVDIPAGLLESIGIAGSGINRYVKGKTGIDLGDEEDPTQTGTYRLGQWLREKGEKISPEPVESLQDSFWATKVPNTLGSIAGFVGAGGVEKALLQGSVKAVVGAAVEDATKEVLEYAAKEGLEKAATDQLVKNAADWASTRVLKSASVQAAQMIPNGLLGAGVQASAAYKEAVANGATPDQAFAAYMANLPVGAAMALPAHAILGEGKTFAGKLVRDTLTGTGVMAGQQVAGNVIARKTYDPNRSPFSGVGEGAGAGAIVTAALSALSHRVLGKRAEPPATESPADEQAAGEQGLNPAEMYELDETSKARVREVLRRELAGDRSLELQTALTSIMADPNLQAFYTLEKGATLPVNAAKTETPVAAPAPEPAPPIKPVEVESVPAAAIQESAVPAEPAPSIAIPPPMEAADVPPAPASIISPERMQQLRQKAILDWRAMQDAKLAAEPPAWVRVAVARVLAKYGRKPPETSAEPPAAEVQPAAQPLPSEPPASEPVQPEPVWKKLTGHPGDLIDRVAFDTAQVVGKEQKPVAITEGKRKGEVITGLGQKSAEAFVETSDPEELFKDVRADANDKNVSRKLGVFLSPDSSHVLIGTAYENGRGEAARKITSFDESGTPRAIQFGKLLGIGYKLIGTLKTRVPTKGYVVTYSPTEWRQIADDLNGQKRAAQGTAAAMEEHLRQAGIQNREQEKNAPAESGLAGRLVGLTNADDVSEGMALPEAEKYRAEGFTQDHAGAIFDAIAELEPDQLETGLVEAIGKSKRAIKGVQTGLKATALATGMTPEEAWKSFKEIIYESRRSNGESKEGFARSISARLSTKGIEDTGESRTESSGDRRSATGIPTETSRINPTRQTVTEEEIVPPAPPSVPAAASEGPHVIYWRNKENGVSGRSKKPMSRAEAEVTAAELNEENPAIEHWVQPDQVAPGGHLEARFSQREANEHQQSDERLRAAWNGAIETAAANGLNISVLQGLHEGGVYSPRMIALTVADPLNPSHDNVTLLFHEIGHDVFRFLHLPPAMEDAFHRAIAKLATPEGFNPVIANQTEGRQAITAEEVLVERAARNLVAEGFDPVQANGIAQRVLRFVQRLYCRAALAIQRSLLGDEHVSPQLAQEYFETRLKSFLAGEMSPMSFLSFLGGPKLTTEQRGETFAPVGGAGAVAGRFNYETGRMEIREVSGETMAGVRFNGEVARMAENSDNTKGTNAKERAYIPERLPQEALRKGGQGNIGAASEVARGVHQAAADAGATEPKNRSERAELARQLRMREELALEDWAKKNDLLLDDREFEKKWREQTVEVGEDSGGSEHDVYEQGGRWYKRNSAMLHRTWLEYFDRLALHNWLFPESAYKFEGFIEHHGKLYAVTSQADVHAVRGATREEVERHMARMGFHRFKSDDYYNPQLGVAVQDLHDENAVITPEGTLIIFDPIPYIPDKLDFTERGMLHGQAMPADLRFSDRGHQASIAFVKTTDPHIISRDLNSPALVEEDVAAYNALHDIHRMAFEAFTRAGLGAKGYTFEEFLRDFSNADTPATEKIKARNDELVASGFKPVDPTLRPHDLMSEASHMQAADKVYRYGWSLREYWSKRRKESEWTLEYTGDRLNRDNQRLHELTKQYTDMSLQLDTARSRLKELHAEFLDDLKAGVGTARKVGRLSQVIAHIEQAAPEGHLAKPYERVINRLYARLTGDRESGFIELLQKVVGLDIDWKTVGVREASELIAKMLAPTDPQLRQLENRAMAAIVVAFAKSNEHVMSFLQLARSSALEERAQLNEILKTAVSDAKDSIPQARQLARKLPRLAVLADRLLTKLEDLKAENHARLDELHRARTFIELHTAVLPGLEARMIQLEKVIGARLQSWEPINDAEYFVAPKPDASAAEVMANKQVFRLTTGDGIADQLREHLKQNNAWLAAVPEDQRGAVWHTVKEMTVKLEGQAAIVDHELVIKRSVINTFLGSIVDKLESTGVPALRSAAKRLRYAQAERHAATLEADNLGVKCLAAEARAMSALGIKDTNIFQRLCFQSALGFAEKNPDIAASSGGRPQGPFDSLLPRLKKYLERDPDMRTLQLATGWSALEAYYRAVHANMEFINSLCKKLGLKIREDLAVGHHIERDLIGYTFFTALRRINRDAVRMYHDMRKSGWLGTETGRLNAARLSELYQSNREALEGQLKKLFTPDVWREFVKPLAQMKGRSAFYGPERADGLTPIALRANVLKAFEQADGNAVRFAEILYELETEGTKGATGPASFVGKTLQNFQDFFDSIHATQKDYDESLRLGLPTPARLLQDARMSESWPDAWLEYQTYGRWEMHQMVNRLTQQAAYGRNMEAMRRDLETGINELTDKADRFTRITNQVSAANPNRSRRALRELVKAEVEKQGASYTVLSEAARNLQMARAEADQFEALLKSQNGLAMELRWFQELVAAMAGATVQGPGTALFQFADFGQAFAKLGLGSVAVNTLRQSAGSFAGEAFGTLAQAFHLKLKFNAERNARRARNGIVDPDARRRFSDMAAAVLHDTTGIENPLTRAVTRGARLLRAVTSSGFGQAQGENSYATLKPHAIFSQFTLQQQFALIDGWVGAFEDMVERASDYFKDPANAGERADPQFQFTHHSELGYSKGVFGIGSDERAFNYLNSALNRNGMRLEDLARDTLLRRQTDPTASAFNDAQFRAMAALVQNEVTLDSNPATRPSSFFTNPVLHLANPLLGWSIAKSHDTWESFRKPDMALTSNKCYRAFLTGTIPYLALVPMGVALAWLREQYDEKLLKKKANRAEPDTFAGMVDVMGRVGTFGVFGDVANSWLNRDTERPFSVDNRVFFVSTLMAAKSALQNWYQQGSADYATVYRPLVQALGGSGYLQYAQILNNALSADNAEARITARINVQNYLRVAGRELSYDVRVGGSGGETLSNPTRPYIGQMVLAAYANDPVAFRSALREALAAAKAEGKPDPNDFVKRSFAAGNPLRIVFKTEPSDAEVMKLIATLPEDGRRAVGGALRLYNGYAEQLGLKPDFGREAKSCPWVFPRDMALLLHRASSSNPFSTPEEARRLFALHKSRLN